MKVSIIVPVYNEARHLASFFENLFKVSFPCATEFVVVDDFSTDDSWKIIQALSEKNNLVTARLPKNQGKGAALGLGIELASGDIIAIQDADFEYDPEDLKRLISPILNDKADVVYGSRFRQSEPQIHRTFHYLSNWLLTLASNIFSGLYLTDMETCYKVFRSDIVKALDLKAKRFGFEPEITAKIAKLKVRVHEYPISYFPRSYIEGKKITWRDGVAALYFIVKFNMQKLPKSTLEKLPEKYRPS